MDDMVINGINNFNVECISSKGEVYKIEKKVLIILSVVFTIYIRKRDPFVLCNRNIHK